MKLNFQKIFGQPLSKFIQKNFLDGLAMFLAIYQSYNMYSGLRIQLQIWKFPVRNLLMCSAGFWDPIPLQGSFWSNNDKAQWLISSKQGWLSVSAVAESWLQYSQIGD